MLQDIQLYREREKYLERVRCAWVRYWCKEIKRPYFHNVVSGDTDWSLPEGAEVQQLPAPEVPETLEIVGSSDEWIEEPTSRYPTLSSSSLSGVQGDDSNRYRRDNDTKQEPMALTGQEPSHHGSTTRSSNVNVEVNQVAREESGIHVVSTGEPCSRQEQLKE